MICLNHEGAYRFQARKFLDRQTDRERKRLLEAIVKLEEEPPQGDIVKLGGRKGYRLRIGGTRFLFEKRETEILVIDIDRRGQVYKGKGKHK
jgi:mRNA-degrading endonuclease RelE of RelBE toxin-antitoxin system